MSVRSKLRYELLYNSQQLTDHGRGLSERPLGGFYVDRNAKRIRMLLMKLE